MHMRQQTPPHCYARPNHMNALRTAQPNVCNRKANGSRLKHKMGKYLKFKYILSGYMICVRYYVYDFTGLSL